MSMNFPATLWNVVYTIFVSIPIIKLIVTQQCSFFAFSPLRHAER